MHKIRKTDLCLILMILLILEILKYSSLLDWMSVQNVRL